MAACSIAWRASAFSLLGVVLSIFLALAGATTPVWADITTNLRVHLKLDETSGTSASDSSGFAQISTLTNGAAFIVPAFIRNGVDLDGTNDFVSVPAQTWSDSATAFTIAWWVNVDTVGDFEILFCKFLDVSNYCQCAFSSSSDLDDIRVDIHTGSASASFVLTTGNYFATGVYTHVAVVYDGSLSGSTNRAKIYVNGSLATTTSTGTIPAALLNSAADTWTFGWRDDSPANDSIDGKMDDIRMYSRALAAGDVLELYNWRDGALVRAMLLHSQTTPLRRRTVPLLYDTHFALAP